MKYRLILFFLVSIISLSFGQGDNLALRKKHFNISKSGLAIEGYDPTSYFKSKPTKGKSSISTIYNGVTYYFTTQENLTAFKANPTKYEPAFGGWCAYAMGAKGTKVEVDPENFLIVNGKNYLFYKDFFNNTIDSWKEDPLNLDKKAITNWSKIYK
jgi:YHS domain-containing protein